MPGKNPIKLEKRNFTEKWSYIKNWGHTYSKEHVEATEVSHEDIISEKYM